jgi:AhpD family alkylhydroperoxidase
MLGALVDSKRRALHDRESIDARRILRLPQPAIMTKVYRDIARSISTSVRKLRVDIPETMKGFDTMSNAALRDGALSEKTKELIALAIGVAGHCDGCLAFHLKALIRLGVTRVEIEEALGVAIYMGGGPSLMYAADALSAFEELSAAN